MAVITCTRNRSDRVAAGVGGGRSGDGIISAAGIRIIVQRDRLRTGKQWRAGIIADQVKRRALAADTDNDVVNIADKIVPGAFFLSRPRI